MADANKLPMDSAFTEEEAEPTDKTRGRPRKTTASTTGEDMWECDMCKTQFTDKRSKVLECEYCRTKRCIKCGKISDTMYKNLGQRIDFPWFCDTCYPKMMKCIK